MNRLRFRLLIGLLVAVALTWGTGAAVMAQQGAKKGTKAAPQVGSPCTVSGVTYPSCTKSQLRQAARQAAAQNRKAQRAAAGTTRTAPTATTLAAPTMSLLAAPAAAPTVPLAAAAYGTPTVPDYFGTTPNYATSPLPTGSIASIVVDFGGSAYSPATTATITDAYGAGTGATATPIIDVNGAITGFTITSPGSGYYAPVVTVTDAVGGGFVGHTTMNNLVGGIRKFMDPLVIPPFAQGSTCTAIGYNGTDADCYEIHLVEYTQKLHTDLPATKLRGYVEYVNGAAQTPSYLGPIIVAQSNRPTRVKFVNDLPTGSGGDLFIPVDTTYMGAGIGPDGVNSFTQNRAAVHLHGGTTPWISDGTVHQWITPAGETTAYPKGVSVRNVPDMVDTATGTGVGCDAANSGCMTFFYSNQQSARLMFYHDHAMGLTRLNVYAGEAAGYLLTDQVEQDLINGTNLSGVNAGAQKLLPSVGIPLVIQDKTFVPGKTQLAAQDPTWIWGQGFPTTDAPNGDLWWPHVYMPNQNPGDPTGANAMGRWDYGPWFWPPFTGLIHGELPNPYFGQPGEPPTIPGMPNPSGTPESFMDLMMVNGVAYPKTTVPAGLVRFRILNASNDRMVNLSFWTADPSVTTSDGRPNTEVKMVPFNSAQNKITPFPAWWYTVITNGFTFDDRSGGVPDPGTRGPAMIQIGTEGGVLPGPVVIKNQPVNYVYNRRDITVGNVAQKALFLAPAERADILVDFSQFAGKTLILYNDSPAPVPAADPRLDYYTNDPDNTDTGGAPSTQAGFAPNTRTVMQIFVDPAQCTAPGGACSGAAPVDYINAGLLTQLQTTLPLAFAKSQDPILVPQAEYRNVYPTDPSPSLNANVSGNNLATIQATTLTFAPLGSTTTKTYDLEPKSIIENFTFDYGKMNALLGIEIKNTNITNQTSIPQGLADPPTELVKVTNLAQLQLIGLTADGMQLWKITHNGVDTHVMHFHMFNVQVVNRVGWDGAIRPPDANELGFKDAVRMNPLEDIIIATRPLIINLPAGMQLSNSIRPLDPSIALGGTTTATGAPAFTNVDPAGLPVTIQNQLANFGWEYVWHCHILGHEENDMMRALVIAVPPDVPTMATPFISGTSAFVTWVEPSINQTSFTLLKSVNDATFANPTTIALGPTATFYTDNLTGLTGSTVYYKVLASNTVGVQNLGTYPTLTASSPYSGAVSVVTVPSAPANLTAVATSPTSVSLAWTAAAGATTYTVQRRTGTGPFANIATGVAATTFVDTTAAARTTYGYQVIAVNVTGPSSPSNIATVTTPAPGPVTPTNLVLNGTAAYNSVPLAWTSGGGQTSFELQRATGTGNGGYNTIATIASTAVGGVQVTFTDTTVAASTTYRYRVRAVNGGNNSGFSNVLQVTTPAAPAQAPATPTNLRVTNTGNATSVTIGWNYTSNGAPLTGFQVWRSDNGGAFVQIATVGSTTRSFTNTGLTRGHLYVYEVRAYNAGAVSAFSNTVNVQK